MTTIQSRTLTEEYFHFGYPRYWFELIYYYICSDFYVSNYINERAFVKSGEFALSCDHRKLFSYELISWLNHSTFHQLLQYCNYLAKFLKQLFVPILILRSIYRRLYSFDLIVLIKEDCNTAKHIISSREQLI